ncbi:hypothetical protein G3N56_06065 [Desulfovibrio sulfodismutans]|uniref:Uncharacterized protein n=1 Tax=Desulfolutivibrio sulfodismutans TaxID=63561 RepID=A0A7K3NJL8_9BACT|nr:hypothetical protein [Desulfolutivibrio sulfodismutans]NDY56307.1 hypothetical protein [Desulfolutivibrio sulfodismutans]QLA11492.1 hypothetical protein GD606_03985 [Desulfolutivibrio sulfodismutans DSM 3696]QLA14208.1 hypothetical protein GD606_19010 [Desulfolutivibrio sulfodismutans DSM 3696]
MEWRTIPGFPDHEVSDSGILRRVGGYIMTKHGRKYRLYNNGHHVQEAYYPYELVEMAFGARENEAAAAPVEAQPPAATGGETEPQPWSPELRSGPVSIPVPAAPDDDRDVELERENRELRALVAELEAELSVYRVAI